MRILIVAATEAEISTLISDCRFSISDVNAPTKPFPEMGPENVSVSNLKSQISYLITGVGMVATAYTLGKALAATKYDLVINLGIAGSFDRTIALGEAVEVIKDTFAELGAEDGNNFLPLNEMGFGEVTFTPNGHPFLNIKQVKGITVNTVHGNDDSIEKVAARLIPQVESMEGAAVFYACREADVACVQIRAVSNYVEKRNRDAWQIGLALKNLNSFAVKLLATMIRPE